MVWLVMDNAAFGTIAGLTNMHYGWEFGCLFEADGARYRTDFAQIAKGYGADGVFIHVGRRARPGADRGAGVGPPDGHPGADGERADADARALGHQLRLPEGQLVSVTVAAASAAPHPRPLGADPGARRDRHDDQLSRSDRARASPRRTCRRISGSRRRRWAWCSPRSRGATRSCRSRAASSSTVRHARHLFHRHRRSGRSSPR